MERRRILVTSALPYANGHIHIGHLVEYLQTDIWVRFQKLRGHDCRYVCADDTHGTAIMIRAKAEGRSEAELIADMSAAHQADFADFGIRFDHYGSTNSEANREAVRDHLAGLSAMPAWSSSAASNELFDPEAGTFLADRFVKGTCPNCGAPTSTATAATSAARPTAPPNSAIRVRPCRRHPGTAQGKPTALRPHRRTA